MGKDGEKKHKLTTKQLKRVVELSRTMFIIDKIIKEANYLDRIHHSSAAETRYADAKELQLKLARKYDESDEPVQTALQAIREECKLEHVSLR